MVGRRSAVVGDTIIIARKTFRTLAAASGDGHRREQRKPTWAGRDPDLRREGVIIPPVGSAARSPARLAVQHLFGVKNRVRGAVRNGCRVSTPGEPTSGTGQRKDLLTGRIADGAERPAAGIERVRWKLHRGVGGIGGTDIGLDVPLQVTPVGAIARLPPVRS